MPLSSTLSASRLRGISFDLGYNESWDAVTTSGVIGILKLLAREHGTRPAPPCIQSNLIPYASCHLLTLRQGHQAHQSASIGPCVERLHNGEGMATPARFCRTDNRGDDPGQTERQQCIPSSFALVRPVSCSVMSCSSFTSTPSFGRSVPGHLWTPPRSLAVTPIEGLSCVRARLWPHPRICPIPVTCPQSLLPFSVCHSHLIQSNHAARPRAAQVEDSPLCYRRGGRAYHDTYRAFGLQTTIQRHQS